MRSTLHLPYLYFTCRAQTDINGYSVPINVGIVQQSWQLKDVG